MQQWDGERCGSNYTIANEGCVAYAAIRSPRSSSVITGVTLQAGGNARFPMGKQDVQTAKFGVTRITRTAIQLKSHKEDIVEVTGGPEYELIAHQRNTYGMFYLVSDRETRTYYYVHRKRGVQVGFEYAGSDERLALEGFADYITDRQLTT